MTQRTKTYLVSQFQDNDVPTGANFNDMITSLVGQNEVSAQYVTNDFLVGGIVQTSGGLQLRRVAISGAGTTQGTGIPLTAPYSVLTPTSADSAYTLPGTGPGMVQMVRNSTAVSAYVFPPSGGTINGLAANAVYQLPGSAKMMLTAETSAAYVTWRMTDTA